MVRWRVGHNSGGTEVSIDPSSIETFKEKPIESFAREIIQNSIDAKSKTYDKVFVEFKMFSIPTKFLPGHKDLADGIFQVLKNWDNKKITRENELRRIKQMYHVIRSENITCIRASDFNTLGLHGVNSNSETSSFYTLTKGDGVSYKGGTSGGSKGIGKFASFVNSEIHTVFYSTVATDGGIGYMGIANLPSGYYIGENGRPIPNLKTNGEWFYADGEAKKPIKGQLNLDPNFKRAETEYGTDIFVVGFKKEEGWENEIIAKTLDSFLVAIYREKLEVKVNGITINKATLSKIIEKLESVVRRDIFRSIKSQYDLLNDPDIKKDEIIIDGKGKIDLYTKIYKKEESSLATKRCILVRFPYMKIKDLTRIITVDFSALAVINDDEINEILRKFENPQHTNWYFERKDYELKDRNEGKALFNEIRAKIKEKIESHVFSSDQKELDFEGAEEFLPDSSVGDFGNTQIKTKKEKPVIHKKRKRKNIDHVGFEEGGLSLNPDIVSPSDEPGDEIFPEGEIRGIIERNKKKKINNVPGDEVVGLRKVELKGVRYHLVVNDVLNGEYSIKFKHTEDLNNCDLTLKIEGDTPGTNEIHDFNIIEAKVNGVKVEIINNKIIGFNVEKDIINIIDFKTDQKEMFSGQVIIHASR